MRKWYRIENAAESPNIADLYIFDFIGDWIDDYWGFGVTAKAFIAELAKLPESVETIRVHVNSPGGDVFAAVAIANTLKQHKAKVEMSIEGLAASAATIVAMAGETIRIGDNALMMVHNPWTIAVGESKDLRKTADELDTVRSAIVATYRWHAKLSDEEIVALMDATTWMDADEAIENGFATAKVEGLKAAATLDPKVGAKLKAPEKYQARLAALLATPPPAPPAPAAMAAADILRECKAAGFLEIADQLVDAKATEADVKARLAEAKEIRGACEAAKVPELAAGFIAARTPIATVKAQLTIVTAKLDKVEIDASLDPNAGTRKKPVIDTAAIYARWNQPVTAATKGA